MKAKSVKINNCSISYLDQGMGFPSLMIHGWLGVKEIFEPLIGELGYKNRMIVPDLPGLGDSQVFKDYKKSGVKEYLDFINNFIEELGVNKFNIWGNSYGAIFALLYAEKYPHKINKIILHAPVYSYKYLHGIFTNFFMRFVIEYSGKIRFLRNIYMKVVEKLFIDKMILGNIEETEIEHKEFAIRLAKKLKETIKRDSAKIIAQKLIVEALKIDLKEAVKTINHPTLIIWGRGDKLNNYQGAEYLLNNMPNAELLKTNNAHSLAREDFENLSEDIDKFLAKE